jgi:hypothetical protein
MEEVEFDVPSPHEHAVEEASERDTLAQRVALTTAILATIGALFSYQSGSAQNEALFLKNESIQRQAEASDQWAYYQSKSTKAHLDAIGSEIASSPQTRDKLAADGARERAEMEGIQRDAKQLEAKAHELSERAERVLRPHERMSLGMTFIQIAVALASITVLTRRRWLYVGSLTAAACGIGVAVSGFF